jgi:hypothetical protein
VYFVENQPTFRRNMPSPKEIYLLPAGFLLVLFFDPGAEGDMSTFNGISKKVGLL